MDHLILLAFATVVSLITIVIHRFSFFHAKKIAHISLMQHLLVVVLPAVFFSIIVFFVLDITSKPSNFPSFLNDKLIIIALFMSLVYTYGGLAIHSICKTLSWHLKGLKNNPAFHINKYFHLQFSHNLIYAGIYSAVVFLSLLEINHAPMESTNKASAYIAIFLGLILGASFIINLKNYLFRITDYSEYKEKLNWSHLKFFFYAFWVAFIIFLIGTKPFLKTLNNYPISLSILSAGTMIALISVFLYTRRIYRKTGFKQRIRQVVPFLF